MRPTEVSDNDIIEAGKSLQSAGFNVTGFALRKRIGGGNPERLFRVWREHLAMSAPPPAATAELPPEVVEGVNQLAEEVGQRFLQVVAGLNDQAVRAAARRVDDVLKESAIQREQADRELADASNAVDELDKQVSSLETQVAEFRQQLAASQEQARTCAIESARVHEQLASEKSRNQELAAELSEQRSKAEGAMLLQGRVDALQQQTDDLLRRLAGQDKA